MLLLLATLALSDVRVDPILAIPINDAFLNDAVIRTYFADLLAKGGSGFLPSERGAFLVRDESGEYRCVLWRRSMMYHEQTFSGRIPERTVAIIHTHPKELPVGSMGDRNTAMRLSVPIFVLTPRNIYLVTARGENVPVVTDQWWADQFSGATSAARCTSADER